MIVRPLPAYDVAVDRRSLLTAAGGGVAGLVLGAGAILRWRSPGRGTHVDVFGIGDWLSVLITHNQRRMLVAGGDNGDALTDVVRARLPQIGTGIDLVLVDGRSSGEFVAAAFAFGARETLFLADGTRSGDSETLQQRSLLDVGDGFALALDPGVNGDWRVTLRMSGDRIVIVPADLPEGDRDQVGITLTGSSADRGSWASVLAPNATPTTGGMTVIGDGNAIRLELTETQIRVGI